MSDLVGNPKDRFYRVAAYMEYVFNRLCSTVMTLSFRTDRSGQTVQTQIRLLLEEQSEQGPPLFAIPLASS